MRHLQALKNYIYRVIFQSSIRRSFTVFMLIATLFPLSVGGITSFTISSQMMQEEVSDSNQAWIAKQKDYLELLLQNIESMMVNIANIDSIKNVLDNETSVTDNYSSLSTQATIGYILSGYNIDGLISIDLISVNGAHYHVGDTLNFQKINAKTSDNLFTLAMDSPNSIIWEGLTDNINENSTHKKVISAVKLIKKIDSETLEEIPVGILIINYNLDSFYEHFAQGNLNKNSTLMIVGQDHSILYHPDKMKIGATVSAEFLHRLTGKSGSFNVTIEGQDMFVVYSNSGKYGWNVLSYIPVDKLTEKARPIIGYSIGAALLSLLLISSYALILSKRVLTPVNRMTLLFKEIGEEEADLSQRLEVKSHDEVGELVIWFNAFLENLAEKKLVEHELKLANEELEIRVKQRTLDLENANIALNNRTKEIQEALEQLRATQDQLIQREKLAGIGQLAAGIAHEINNPLGYVSSNMASLERYIDHFKELLTLYQQLKLQLERKENEDLVPILEEILRFEKENSLSYVLEDLKELFEDVNTGLDRVGKIVKSLRMFSWIDHEAVFDEAYDLNKGIENSLLIAQNEIKYVATVEQKLGNIPLIEAIGSEINQVLLNIIINAVHAIKMKEIDAMGIIKLSTENDEEFVYCIIEDNGIGIAPEHLKQMFNPFFTTKPVGEGTGLGLSISYDIIVNQHHGTITGESQVGIGSKFTMTLPIHQQSTQSEEKE